MGDHSEYGRRVGAVIRLSGEVLSEAAPEEMLCRAAEAARELTGARIAFCAPMDPAGRFLEGGAASVFSDKAVYLGQDRFGAEPYLEDLLGRMSDRLTIRRPEEDLSDAVDRTGVRVRQPVKGLLGARLVDGSGHGVGVILLACRTGGDFTGEDEEILGHFAFLCAGGLRHAAARKEMLALQQRLCRARDELESVISRRTAALSKINRALKAEVLERKKTQEQIRSYHEQLRFLASELSLSEERERRRIAVAVHDHVSQNLAAAKIKLEAARAGAPPEMAAPLKEIQGFIEDSIQDTRSIVMELSPPILYELGLISALEWLAENIQAKHGLDVTFEGDGLPPPGLDRNIQILLFQVARELLWNVVKHAGARHARICFRCLRRASRREDKEERIQIRVEDDGIGFDPAGTGRYLEKNSGGFGIFSIRERLRPLGGQMLMESAPGKGTCAVIELPIQPIASS